MVRKMVWVCFLLLIGPLSAAPSAPSPTTKAEPSKPTVKVKTIVDYAEILGLTDTQVHDIGQTLEAFRATTLEQRHLAKLYQDEYAKLVDAHAPLDEIKAKLRQWTEASFVLKFADVETSRRLEGVLTAEQLASWREIQSKARAEKNKSS